MKFGSNIEFKKSSMILIGCYYLVSLKIEILKRKFLVITKSVVIIKKAGGKIILVNLQIKNLPGLLDKFLSFDGGPLLMTQT